jgi:hypothetical protein
MMYYYVTMIQLLVNRKRKRERDSSELPDMLTRSTSLEIDEEAEAYCEELSRYNERTLRLADSLITDVKQGLKHCSIHCVSVTERFATLIGFDLIQFSRLFMSVRHFLKEMFPRSPEIIEEHEAYRSLQSSRRMKLFMFLFRFRQGCSYSHMESLFGWSKSVIEHACNLIMDMIHIKLNRLLNCVSMM